MFISIKIRSLLAGMFIALGLLASSCSGIVSLDDEPMIPQDEIMTSHSSGHSSEGD